MVKPKSSNPKHGKHNPDSLGLDDVHVGSGRLKSARPHVNKWLAAFFILIFGALGSYLLFVSHADSTGVLFKLQSSSAVAPFNSLYTTDPATVQSEEKNNNWVLTGQYPFVSEPGSDPVPVYRGHQPNTHNNIYVTNVSKIPGGWSNLGISFYESASAKVPYGFCRNTSSGFKLDAPCNTNPAPTQCTAIPGGKKCVSGSTTIVTCNNGYVKSGLSCVPVTCNTAIANGSKCTDGTIRCNAGYVLTGSTCSITCTVAIAGGTKCSNGAVKCSSDYKASNGACYKVITCKSITGGQSCSDGKVTCKVGYYLDKGACTKVTCKGIVHGQDCKVSPTGHKTTCNDGYYANGTLCSKVVCNNIANGKQCLDGTPHGSITCNSGYYEKGSACVKNVCGAITGGKACTDGAITCNAGYMRKASSCVPVICNTAIANGSKCTDGTIKCNSGYNKTRNGSACVVAVTCKQAIKVGSTTVGYKCSNGTLKCSSGYTIGGTTCIKLKCKNVSHGKNCNDVVGLHCDSGYFNREEKCTKVVCGALANGKICNNGSILCARNYTANANKTKCIKVTCINNLVNGKTCNDGRTICNSGYYDNAGTCNRIVCTPLANGRNCTNGTANGKTTCDTNYFLKDNACTRLTCDTKIAGGHSCNNDTIRCDASDYFKQQGKTNAQDKCIKITCSDLDHGKTCNDGKTTCNRGWTPANKHCTIDNSIVLAYNGFNDGCGGTATHYASNRTTHVNTTHDGRNSVCVCNNGTVITYGKDGTSQSHPMRDSSSIKQCAVSTNHRSTGGGSASGQHRGSGQSSGSGQGASVPPAGPTCSGVYLASRCYHPNVNVSDCHALGGSFSGTSQGSTCDGYATTTSTLCTKKGGVYIFSKCYHPNTNVSDCHALGGSFSGTSQGSDCQGYGTTLDTVCAHKGGVYVASKCYYPNTNKKDCTALGGQFTGTSQGTSCQHYSKTKLAAADPSCNKNEVYYGGACVNHCQVYPNGSGCAGSNRVTCNYHSASHGTICSDGTVKSCDAGYKAEGHNCVQKACSISTTTSHPDGLTLTVSTVTNGPCFYKGKLLHTGDHV